MNFIQYFQTHGRWYYDSGIFQKNILNNCQMCKVCPIGTYGTWEQMSLQPVLKTILLDSLTDFIIILCFDNLLQFDIRDWKRVQNGTNISLGFLIKFIDIFGQIFWPSTLTKYLKYTFLCQAHESLTQY